MEAFEKIVHFDEEGNLLLKLGKDFSKKEAKVVVLIKDDEITEKEWLSVAMKGGAYDFLNDPAEDIYTMEDGVPYKSDPDEV
ncbi:MAG TPA: hypothetical protein VLS85_00130 [Hanamia sp.]|jgi:hypothetical protein|nr:hypothetical protein [Hanamia sp.]